MTELGMRQGAATAHSIDPHVCGLLPPCLPAELVTPAPELVVFGCGERVGPLPPAAARFLRSRGVAYELVDTVSEGCPPQAETNTLHEAAAVEGWRKLIPQGHAGSPGHTPLNPVNLWHTCGLDEQQS